MRVAKFIHVICFICRSQVQHDIMPSRSWVLGDLFRQDYGLSDSIKPSGSDDGSFNAPRESIPSFDLLSLYL